MIRRNGRSCSMETDRCSLSPRRRPTPFRSGSSALTPGAAVRSLIGGRPRPSPSVAASSRKPARSSSFRAKAAALAGALFGVDAASAPSRDPFAAGKLATALPEGVYRFANPTADADLAALGFLLGALPLRRFKADPTPQAAAGRARRGRCARIERIAAAVAFGRDLVNAPANVLGPDALEEAAVGLAEGFGAKVGVIRGEDLLTARFPLVHAVGKRRGCRPRGSSTSPGGARARRK